MGTVSGGNSILVRDGRWSASSNRSGTFRDLEARHRSARSGALSVRYGGGTNPHESADGKQLFYTKGGPANLEIWSRPVNGDEESRCSVLFTPHPRCSVPDLDGIYYTSQPGGSPITGCDWCHKDNRPASTERSGCEPRPCAVARRTLAAVWQRDRSVSDIMLVETSNR